MAKKKEWIKPAVPAPEVHSECPDCGLVIYKLESIWQMTDRFVCFDCREVYQEMGLGYMDCAGLVLPGVTLEG